MGLCEPIRCFHVSAGGYTDPMSFAPDQDPPGFVSCLTDEDRVILARLEAEGRLWSFVREQHTPREWRAIKRGCEDTVNRLREEYEWSAPWRATHGLRVELNDGVEEFRQEDEAGVAV